MLPTWHILVNRCHGHNLSKFQPVLNKVGNTAFYIPYKLQLFNIQHILLNFCGFQQQTLKLKYFFTTPKEKTSYHFAYICRKNGLHADMHDLHSRWISIYFNHYWACPEAICRVLEKNARTQSPNPSPDQISCYT